MNPFAISFRENFSRKKKAKEDFEQWFESANDFLMMHTFGKEKGILKNSAFQLHQATERYFAALLLVFTQYKPRTHDIELLDHQVSTLDPQLCTVFPKFTKEERRLFELLKKAYIDARYKKSYTITAEELTYLAGRVGKLQQLTEDVCKREIGEIVK